MTGEPEGLLDESYFRAKRKALLKSYLKELLVSPLPKEERDRLTELFTAHPDPDAGVVVPTLDYAKQVAQCYLLAVGRGRDWSLYSAGDLTKSVVENSTSLTSHVQTDILILFYGFDSLPNKLIIPMVNQIVTSRALRNRRTLVCLGREEPLIEVSMVSSGKRRAPNPKKPAATEAIALPVEPDDNPKPADKFAARKKPPVKKNPGGFVASDII